MKLQYIAILLLLTCCGSHDKKSIQILGRFSPSKSADIRAEVTGTLLEVHFQDGQTITEGDLLFTIDSKSLEAKLDLAVANRGQNISKLKYAAEKVDRFQTLLSNKYISEIDCVPYITELNQCESAVMQNEAEIRLAKINLEKCRIKAPFQGIVGKHLIDKGNLILGDNPTLVHLTQIDPIYIDFTLTEKEYAKISTDENIHIYLNNMPIEAKMIITGSSIIQMRAEIPNPLGSIKNLDIFGYKKSKAVFCM